MPTISTLRRTEHEIRAMERKKAELEVMPAVDFWYTPEEESDDKYERNKDLYVTISIKFDPDAEEDDAPTYSARIKCFKTGNPEEYCQHRVAVTEAATKLGYLKREYNADGAILAEGGGTLTEAEAENIEA